MPENGDFIYWPKNTFKPAGIRLAKLSDPRPSTTKQGTKMVGIFSPLSQQPEIRDPLTSWGNGCLSHYFMGIHLDNLMINALTWMFSAILGRFLFKETMKILISFEENLPFSWSNELHEQPGVTRSSPISPPSNLEKLSCCGLPSSVVRTSSCATASDPRAKIS